MYKQVLCLLSRMGKNINATHKYTMNINIAKDSVNSFSLVVKNIRIDKEQIIVPITENKIILVIIITSVCFLVKNTFSNSVLENNIRI
jgi:hypothetical protein